MDGVCAYCALGLNEIRELEKPLGELVEPVGENVGLGEILREEMGKDWGMNDVLSTEFEGFDLGRELWSYE